MTAKRKGPAKKEIGDLPPHLEKRLKELIPRLFELGMGCIHSAESESDGIRDTEVDCSERVGACRSVCCSFRFALTEEEVAGGVIQWDESQPYLILQGENGYCTHHDPETMRCLIWENRPLRCRRYDCRRESSFWEEGERLRVREGTFDHLKKARSRPRDIPGWRGPGPRED